MRSEPIAIVGRGCVLPGASTPDDFWRNVAEGRDQLSTVPAHRWRVNPTDVSGTPGASVDRTWGDIGGYVTDASCDVVDAGLRDPLDAALASILARTDAAHGPSATLPLSAESLDPLFAWTIRCAHEALTESGQLSRRGRTGLVMGNLSFPSTGAVDYAERAWFRDLADRSAHRPESVRAGLAGPVDRFMSGLPATLAARTLELGLGGFALDAACASSLYAIAVACGRLVDRSADVMVAGGSSRADDLFTHISFCTLSALSRTGRSRPFHRDADGLVPGEGAAVVALMRLEDAVSSGAPIFGVIRGIGLSNDGRRGGVLAPSESGQIQAMVAAYEAAGIDPATVGLLECHATGTPVGDAAEIRSTATVFAESGDLPIGSLKSNTGHLLTTAGAAGLLKILGALGSGSRPPTLHVNEPSAALDGTPLRPLRELEDWSGSRRAAISAFGFGGNNAHLIVDAWTGDTVGSASVPASRATPEIAVVAVEANVGTGNGVVDLCSDLLLGRERRDRRTDISVELDGLSFPPTDLADAQPQQVLLLQTARDAARGTVLPTERTMVLVGMGCDPEVARYAVRWRVPGWTDAAGTPLSDESSDRVRSAIRPPQTPAGVAGSMPNVVANRINAQLGITGPGFTVSAEELSGTAALDVAADWLRRGATDAAIVGAVDLSHEAVHRSALHDLGIDAPPGDVAVVLVLKRLDDARRAGDTVLALVGGRSTEGGRERGDDDVLLIGDDDGSARRSSWDPVSRFGRSHAAHGLLAVATAVLASRHRAEPRDGTTAAPSLDSAPVDVAVRAVGGETARVRIAPAEAQPFLAEEAPTLHVFAGESTRDLIDALGSGRESSTGVMRLVVVATASEYASRVAAATQWLTDGGQTPKGVTFGEGVLDGDVVFVFPGGSMAYADMGRELLLAFPSVLEKVAARSGPLRPLLGWAYEQPARPAHAMHQVWGASVIGQVHAGITGGILGIKPAATIGYSSGELTALIAMGAWPDPTPITSQVSDTTVALSVAGTELDIVREVWNRSGIDETRWVSYLVEGPVSEVRKVVASESSVHITVVNAPTSCVIGGGARGCSRVVAALSDMIVLPIEYDIPAHVPELGSNTEAWLETYRLATVNTGLRTYTCSTSTWFEPTTEDAAHAATAQQLGPIDFAATVEQAWQDGGRIFVELGPRSLCSSWIGRTLGERDHLAVALDSPDGRDVHAVVSAAATLVAAGVPADYRALNDHLSRAWTAPRVPGTSITFAAHAPDIDLDAVASSAEPVVVPKSASLPESPTVTTPLRSVDRDLAATVHRVASESHRSMLTVLSQTHLEFLGTRGRAVERLISRRPAVRPHRGVPARLSVDAGAADVVAPTSARSGPPATGSAPVRTPDPTPPSRPQDGMRHPHGPSFGRRELEQFADDSVVPVLGSDYAHLDRAARRIRMPAPPLLLVDEILGIDAVQGELGASTIWTRSTVVADSWYLDPAGRMCSGALAESGQASLVSLAWIGADSLSHGGRVYRLLGCKVTHHGPLPRPGDVIRFEITLDEYVPFGDPPLFTFRMQCFVGDVRTLTITDGRAGMFTDEELRDAVGLSWQPAIPGPVFDHHVATPPVATERRSFDACHVTAFAEGRPFDCFGPGWEVTSTHVRTPRISSGKGKFIDEVTSFEPNGGPWKRGYLRASMSIDPTLWFFAAHFPNDPCMPGTLMAEGCTQAMAFFLAASGYTVDRDGWRFEPAPDVTFDFDLRGQVVPTTSTVVYEVFVHDVVPGPLPTLIADVLCTVDGIKACHVGVVQLRLVPDWPLDQWKYLHVPMVQRDGHRLDPAELGGLVDLRESGSVLREGDFSFGRAAMLACAWGKPSDGFGPPYAIFDGPRRAARLPSPPFHFVTRAVSSNRPAWQVGEGSRVVVEYEVPEHVWYFEQNDSPVMPMAISMEVVLQACGWFAGYLGSALGAPTDLYFRNLQGKAEFREHIRPGVKVLTTKVTLTKVIQSADVIIESFEAECFADGRPWCSLETVFGFFPRRALETQVGIEPDAFDLEGIEAEPFVHIDLSTRPEAYFERSLRLPGPMLQMLDRVTGVWLTGGSAGLGRLRAEKDVSPNDWFFAAHFFQDPVQPGSLGVQAICQLIQFYVVHTGVADNDCARFDPLALETPVEWTYRGQVTPTNRLVTVTADIVRVERGDCGLTVAADGALWVDGRLIYRVRGLTIAVVS